MRLRQIWEQLRSNLWFRALLWALGLSLTAVFLLLLDRWLEYDPDNLASTMLGWYLVGGAAGTRALLSVIATAVITIASLAYSVVMVAVVQTSNAYSPRILKQYLSDTSNQHVLGILIGTFLYTLIVLQAVHNPIGGGEMGVFISPLAVNGALLLSILSIGAFIYFINHAAHSVAVSSMIRLILEETERLIDGDRIFPEPVGRPCTLPMRTPRPDGPFAVYRAPEGGYLESIVTDELLDRAGAHNACFEFCFEVGNYVLPGATLVRVWPPGALDEELRTFFDDTLHIEAERTLVQDVLYGVDQIADVALRALSPGINDPSTANTCIDALALLGVKLSQHGPIADARCDAAGKLRVIAEPPDFAQFMDKAFSEIRRNGVSNLMTARHMLATYAKMAAAVERPEERALLWQHAQWVLASADGRIAVEADRVVLNTQFMKVAEVLELDPRPYLLDLE